MPVWKFEILQSGNNGVQSVGLRPFIVSFILERGIERGDAVNSTDGKRVSVFLECADRKTAVNFRRMLAAEIRNEAKSAYSNLPLKFKLSALEKENHNSCNVPLLSDKALATTLSQTSKGVGVMLSIDEKLDRLPERIAKNTDCEMRSLRTEVRRGFDKLPVQIAKNTKRENNSLKTEIRRGFDRLPGRIAKAIAGAKAG